MDLETRSYVNAMVMKYRCPRCHHEEEHTVPLHFPTLGYLYWRATNRLFAPVLFSVSRDRCRHKEEHVASPHFPTLDYLDWKNTRKLFANILFSVSRRGDERGEGRKGDR
jgi:hypothetical protein